MRLRKVILEGFRGYSQRVEIPISDLTAIVGKNDAGKSSVLEALEIFFNAKSIKMDPDDACKAAGVDPKKVLIGCAFDDLPDSVVLDSACETDFATEEMLNAEGMLEIHKVFDCSKKTPTSKTFIHAQHRSQADGSSILAMKNPDLKKAVKEAGLTVEDNKKNPLLRAALRDRLAGGAELVTLPMEDGNCTAIQKEIEKQLPIFALFRSDRPSTDADSEVQDPVKLATDQAIKEAEEDLKKAEEQVTSQVGEVLNRTLDKLRDIAPGLANELKPRIDSPDWRKAFKIRLDSDDDVPMNKRGSGVRRLILLSFFRAEAERRRNAADVASVIYAIEEPETSQHPNNQRMLMEAFTDLTEAGTAQVLLTTHVPGLAGMVPVESIRFVETVDDGVRRVKSTTESDADEELLQEVASSLGVIPDSRVNVLFFVEGPNDVEFFKNASCTLATADGNFLDLSVCEHVAFVPVGGQTLEQWVERHYLAGLNRPEYHVYDGEYAADPGVVEAIAAVNARADGSKARVLTRLSAECYLHADAIKRHFEVEIEVKPDECAATAVAAAMSAAGLRIPLDEGKSARPHKNVIKRLLNSDVAQSMTTEEWSQSDPDGELTEIFAEVHAMASG